MKAVARCSVAAAGLALMCLSGPVKADMGREAVAASIDLYERMTVKDLPGFLRYRPQEGYSSFNPETKQLQVLDLKPFEELFGSNKQIKLKAEDLKVRLIGEAAVVTGARVGYIAPPDVAAVEERFALTMIWSKVEGQMKLRHLHYSQFPK